MAKMNRINDICNAITEIREILSSSSFQSPLLRQDLKKNELQRLNELYDEARKKSPAPKRSRAMNKSTSSQGGRNEIK